MTDEPNNLDDDRSQKNWADHDRNQPETPEEILETITEEIPEFEEMLEHFAEQDRSSQPPTTESTKRKPQTNEGTSETHHDQGDEFHYPSEDSPDESRYSSIDSEKHADDVDELDQLRNRVEELREELSEVTARGQRQSDRDSRQDAPSETTGPEPRRYRQRRDIETSASTRTRGEKKPSSTISITETVDVLTEIIEMVTSIGDELSHTKHVNKEFWDILNDIQLRVEELEQDLSNHSHKVRYDDQRVPIEEAIQRLDDQVQPLLRLVEEFEAVTESIAENRVEKRRSDSQKGGPSTDRKKRDRTQRKRYGSRIRSYQDESDKRRTDISNRPPEPEAHSLREEVNELRDQVTNMHPERELASIQEEIDELRDEVNEEPSTERLGSVREEIDDLRDFVANIEDDVEALKHQQESELLEEQELKIAEGDLREDIRQLEQENRAIKELLSGLQSRVD